MRRLFIDVIVLDALRRFERLYALDKRRFGDAQRQCLCVVAIDATNRVVHQLHRVRIGQLVDLLESLGDVAIAQLLVCNIGRSMTVHACARLRGNHLALGIGLVFQHIGMAALFAEIRRESVTLPHGLESGILLDL